MTQKLGMSPFAADFGGAGKVISIGPIQAAPLSKIVEEEKQAVSELQNEPYLTGLAAHVRKCWTKAWDAKQQDIEPRMYKAVRARRGEYDPDKIAAIRETGGSEVYANLTSVKCRAAASWLRDVLLSGGKEKPWTIRPGPVPDINPAVAGFIENQIQQKTQMMVQNGIAVDETMKAQMTGKLRDAILAKAEDVAKVFAERMEDKMEDQLNEGGFPHALNQFIDDIVTFPSAFLKGPVIRQKPKMTWKEVQNGQYEVQVERMPVLEFERVSPFDIYPSPEAEGINEGYLIEKHRLSRKDLTDMIGVPGYDDGSIREILREYGRNGLRDWLYDDISRHSAEGKSSFELLGNPDHLIDALQFWGSVSGQMLRDFGMSAEDVPDETTEYHAEVWLIGRYVIKAVINRHPLGDKPYFKASYEEIPGSFWGNAPTDLIRDAQSVVNAATRALVNNMGLASGPQVVVNVDRLAPGEDVTTLKPWRIWQVTSESVAGLSHQQPIHFDQPKSNIAELSGIITTFMNYADEWSGIPKYLTGDSPGGAGRTASGLSMLMNNAGKSLKQVVSNVDNYILRPMLERLHYWNMMYSDDKHLKGDVNIVVRGANALVAKEAAMMRRNEFLQMTANPIDMQIVGLDGRANVLREVAKQLDMDTDKIIPNELTLKQRQEQAAKAQAEQAAKEMQKEQGSQPSPGGGQTLMDGAPVVDNASPPKQG